MAGERFLLMLLFQNSLFRYIHISSVSNYDCPTIYGVMEETPNINFWSEGNASSSLAVDSAETFDVQLLLHNNFETPQQQMPSCSANPSFSLSSLDDDDDDDDDIFSPPSVSI